jgi:hypothetical protein
VLSGDAVAIVLHAILTGFSERAINVIAMSDEIDERERSVLWTALAEPNDRSDQARRFGDALRSLAAPNMSVNEAYRAAFYASEHWKSLSENPLFAYFAANRSGTPLDKWVHYFPIYEAHLARFRGSAARVLEIGVYRGGGLEMLRHYLGPDANLVGVDIDASVRDTVQGRYIVEVGDQADPEFMAEVAERHGPFDVVIDDGGHTMRQQITSVETVFPRLADDGIYIVEDCHTSYWPDYADPTDEARTFVAWAKDRLDDLHAYHHSIELDLTAPWQTDLSAVHAYDSVVVLDKARRFAPFSEVTGTSDYVNVNRGAAIANVELLATREVALRSAKEAEAEAARLVDEAEQRIAEAESRMSTVAEASEDELRILRAELTAANQHSSRLRSDLDATREELDDTSSKLIGSWEIIQEMRQSRSWQLTAPIRRVKSLIRRR